MYQSRSGESLLLIVLALICVILISPGVTARSVDQAAQRDIASYTSRASLPACELIRSVVHETSEIRTAVHADLCWGHASGFAPRNDGFVTPADNAVDYLYSAGIWIGGIVDGDTLVSVSNDCWLSDHEFVPFRSPDGTTVQETNFFAGRTVHILASDSADCGPVCNPHIPLGVDVSLRSHSFDEPGFEKLVLYDMVVSNNGDKYIEECFVGIQFDCDISEDANYAYHDDLAGFLWDHGIAYTIDFDFLPDTHDGSPADRAFASKIHRCWPEPEVVNFNWWYSNGNPYLDFGPRLRPTENDPWRDFATGGIGTPVGDSNQYYVLSHPEFDYDGVMVGVIPDDDSLWMDPTPSVAVDFWAGEDVRYLHSMGPFDLQPGDRVRVIFSTVTGEEVQTNPHNRNNLPHDPEAYLAGLDFSDVILSAAMAEQLVDSLLDLSKPVLGLRLVSRQGNTATVRWDPWVLPEVEGYAVFVREYVAEDYLHEDAPPFFVKPRLSDLYATFDEDIADFTFTDLNPNSAYAVAVAHLDGSQTHEMSESIVLPAQPRRAAPKTECEFAFSQHGGTARISWQLVLDTDLSHYNIYRVDSPDEYEQRHHPFYDKGCRASSDDPEFHLTPTDDFLPPGHPDRIYYYRMEPYARADEYDTEFIDHSPVDGGVYFISAVNNQGYESEFSAAVQFHVVDSPEKEVLLISDSYLTFDWVEESTVLAYYDRVLEGVEYDVYYLEDSLRSCASIASRFECLDWRDFTRYRTVIIDNGIHDDALLWDYHEYDRGFQRYIASGGTLVYFGSLNGCFHSGVGSPPDRYPSIRNITSDLFSIDTMIFAGAIYCYPGHSLPCPDEITGFNTAVPIAELPQVSYDTTANPMVYQTSYNLWPESSPPHVTAFTASEGAEITHVASTLDPSLSILEGEAIGVRKEYCNGEAYAFGFHLWYMEPLASRDLLGAIAGIEGCCQIRGDIDHNGSPPDISDVVYLVDFFFRQGPAPPCDMEADLNLSGGVADISDLIVLVDYLFGSGPPPPDCP